MNKTLETKLIDILTNGASVPVRSSIESHYPPRKLADGAEVTRFAPSPTGFVHIGAIFSAMISKRVAHDSGGVYMLRIEDTDKKREVEGAKALIAEQLEAFGVAADEGLQADGSIRGTYGPYVQSERSELYLSFAVDLLRKGRAYPCFANAEELQAAVADQQSKKLRPGYYGQWALWRDKSDEEVAAALDAGKPFVLRFRSEGSHDKRITFEDRLKGTMVVPENDLDVPLIKSGDHRLPTYHLAHVVDDYLMGTTLVLRGEEWLPSTPLHIELTQSLSITPFTYGHMPVISIVDANGGGKRKLSKRKDPEADVAYWREAAYPLRAIKAYLLGLANSNFEDWYRENPDASLEDFPFSLEKLKTSRSPLLDVKKLEDYAKDEIARMPQEHFNKEVLKWTQVHSHDLYEEMVAKPDYTKEVLAIERGGEKPRKDVSRWSDVPEQFGYFYDVFFEKNDQVNIAEQLADIPPENITAALEAFTETYDHNADKDAWFDSMKKAVENAGYCLDRKELKANPGAYKGGIADFAKIIRVKLTSKTRTPDLWTIMQIMGEDRISARLSK